MTEYYEGTRYCVTAHYGLLKDKKVEHADTRQAANRLISKHFKKGANVALTSHQWVEVTSHLAFYDQKREPA